LTFLPVWGFAGTVAGFIIATGLIGRYSQDLSESYAAAATVFLYIYIVL
jgi:flagellar motor component MotA